MAIAAGLLLFYSKLTFDLTPWAQAVMSAVTTVAYSDRSTFETTTVLLFTDDDLRRVADDRFPIPYEKHALVLRGLNADEVRPRALFIDFAFLQPRVDPSFAALSEAICALHAARVPVFVLDTSGLTKRGQTGEGSAPVLAGCAQPVGAYIDRDEPGGGVMSYPVCGSRPEPERHPENLSQWVERLTHRLFGWHAPPCTGPYSAAYALWKMRDPDASTRAVNVSEDDRMALVWPARTWSTEYCAPHEGLASIVPLLLEAYDEGADVFKRRCPYSQRLSVGDFLREGADSEAVRAHLRDRVVLYGAKLTLSGDVVSSPAYKDLPGVFYHAMAYDNLLTFAGAPKREPPRWLKFAMAVVLSAMVYWRAGHAHAKSPTRRTPQQSLDLFGRIVLVVFAVLPGAVGFVGLGLLMGSIPEYLVLGCFVLYVGVRLVTDREIGLASLLCFVVSLSSYLFLHVSIDFFFAMILFLEVAHLVLHFLSSAAQELVPARAGNEVEAEPRSAWQRFALFVLSPFKND